MPNFNRSLHAFRPQPRLPRMVLAVAWIALLSAVVLFLWDAGRKYGSLDAIAYQLFENRRGWLWAHLAGGAVTLLIGPFQFVDRFRRAYPRIHRWGGRTYLIALLIGSFGAAGLIATTPAGYAIQVAFAATELAWLITALKAYLAIRNRQIEAHRRWMIRNYIVTFVFVTFRATSKVPGIMTLADPAVMISTLLWLSWVVPILACETARQVNHLRASKRERTWTQSTR